ncbi:MAG TPA: VOC family protein [Sedimentisphaerales bacterium]|nr:VOC family protein [Sedimentisphaerales bacterium]
MRILFSFWLLLGAAFAEDLPLLGLAHVGFRVGDLEKARAFYHGVLGYDEAFDFKAPDGHVSIAYFKVNDNQFIEVFPGIPPGTKVMMSHIAMYTGDIEKMHKMIEDRGLAPGKINDAKDGNRSFAIRNLPGQSLEFLEFVQYMPNSWHRQSAGKFLSDRRVSTKLLHAGIVITDFEAARHFYVDELGFTVGLQPKPGGQSKPVQVPFGHHIAIRMPGPSGDYMEIGNARQPPTGRWVGVYAHVSLAVPDIDAAYRLVQERELPEDQKSPHDRWLDLYDPEGSRVELAAPKASGK